MATENKEAKRSYSKIFRRLRNTVSGGSGFSSDSKSEKSKAPGTPKGHRKEQSEQMLPMAISNSQATRLADIDSQGSDLNLNSKPKPMIKDLQNVRTRSETVGTSSDDNLQIPKRIAPSFSTRNGLGDMLEEESRSLSDVSLATIGDSQNSTLGRFTQRFPAADKYLESIIFSD